MQEDLLELIKREIKNISDGKISTRVLNFNDFKSKYSVLKPMVKVEIELTKGVIATIDISDYFKEELN